MVKIRPEELKLVRGGIAGPPIVVLGGGGPRSHPVVTDILVGVNNVSLAAHMPRFALETAGNALLSAGV